MDSLIKALAAAVASLSSVVATALPLIGKPTTATDPAVVQAIDTATSNITSIATDLANAVAARQAADQGGSPTPPVIPGSTGEPAPSTDPSVVGSVPPAASSAESAPVMASHVQ